jgi:hypothetical protein
VNRNEDTPPLQSKVLVKARRLAVGSFISEGPLIDLTANGKGMGDTIYLPSGGGRVRIQATLSAPLELKEFHLVRDGSPLEADWIDESSADTNHWVIEKEIHFEKSGWVTAWGKGPHIITQKIDAMAHAGVIRVIVGNEPVESTRDALALIHSFQELISWYQADGVYENENLRKESVALLEAAILKLQDQLE